jgi:hypothetical protein
MSCFRLVPVLLLLLPLLELNEARKFTHVHRYGHYHAACHARWHAALQRSDDPHMLAKPKPKGHQRMRRLGLQPRSKDQCTCSNLVNSQMYPSDFGAARAEAAKRGMTCKEHCA